MTSRWRLIRHHRAAIGDMAEYVWVRPNLEMAKSDAASDAQEIHGKVVGDPEWVKRESDPVTYVWEIDSDHWYSLTQLAEELRASGVARVLVVEDEHTGQVILGTILEGAGHQVCFATDGVRAFDLYVKNRIDIVVTDLYMPHGGGVEFIGTLRAAFPEALVVAVSGKGQHLLDAAKSKGAFLTLSKPVDPQELMEAIAQAVPGDDDLPVSGEGSS